MKNFDQWNEIKKLLLPKREGLLSGELFSLPPVSEGEAVVIVNSA